MSAVIAVAAALGLVGIGMLVSPEMARLRKRRRKRKGQQAATPIRAVPDRPFDGAAEEPTGRPSLHVIHGDGGTVVPFRPRRAETFASSPPGNPRGDGPDAA